MRNLFVLVLCLSFLCVEAKKKKAAKDIQVISATYSNNDNSIRIVGQVYQFTIQTMVDDLTIDSVWFGATPVPCTLLTLKTKERLNSAATKETYLLQANRNLYANFPGQADSTQAAKLFKPPFAFRGKAIIMYRKNGVRMYEVVNNVKEVAPPKKRQ